MIKKRTTFGSLVAHFRFERKTALENAERDLWERNKLVNPTKRDGYKIVELSTIGNDGSTTYSVQLWKLIDEEHIKVSTNVEVGVLGKEEKTESSSDLGDLLS